jgi:tRNA pseudouridine55 synthase
MNSIFAIWKPKGFTSHEIVDLVRRATGEKRVGHAGTLDPLAEGVLIIATGQSTKLLSSIVNKEKEYIATIKLGEWSTTDDAEGEKTPVDGLQQPSLETIAHILSNFVGEIDQVPPAYSAIKVAGQRAYRIARSGRTPKLKPRRVIIKELQLISYEWPFLSIKAVTGPGVYIRSLARDIGQALGTGGYLAVLERVRIGNFRKKDCIPLDSLVK